MSVPRASLSPSRFSDSAFKEFKRVNTRVIYKTGVIADVLITIKGEGRKKYYLNRLDHLFNHLEPLVDFLPVAKPDIYNGVLPAQID